MTPFISFFWTYLLIQTTRKLYPSWSAQQSTSKCFLLSEMLRLGGKSLCQQWALFRSCFWWPPLCYSDSKRRPGQLLLINCLISPIGNCCSRFIVSRVGRCLQSDTSLRWFHSFSIDFRGQGSLFPTSAPQGLCLNASGINMNICIYLTVKEHKG